MWLCGECVLIVFYHHHVDSVKIKKTPYDGGVSSNPVRRRRIHVKEVAQDTVIATPGITVVPIMPTKASAVLGGMIIIVGLPC